MNDGLIRNYFRFGLYIKSKGAGSLLFIKQL